MVSASRRSKLSFVIGFATYIVGIAVLVAVGGQVAWQGAAALLAGVPTPSGDAPRTQRPGAREQPAGPGSAVVQGSMNTLADRWDGRWGGPYSEPPQTWRSSAMAFGARPRKPQRDDDDEDFAADDARPTTFRTVCVRLCDGYFFPISFAVGADRLEHDARVCESRCGAQGRLFVHPNPGGSTDDLHDLSGRPYRHLRTAFLYRSTYIASCRCQPQPWDPVALDRHRAYALAAAAGRGNREAAMELQALEVKLKEDAKSGATPAQAAQSGDVGQSGTEAAARAAEIARREDGNYMGLSGGLSGGPSGGMGRLGGQGASAAKAEAAAPKSRPDQDWQHRIFDPSAAR